MAEEEEAKTEKLTEKIPVPSRSSDRGGSTDPIRLYLKDIRKTPLLSREEEVELAKKVQAGDKKARRWMIQANLRLVVSIAKRYLHLGLPLLDLVEEGNLGLIKAVEKYDHRKGCRFSTYASWWIKQGITRALASQGKLIRVPIYMAEMINRLHRVTVQLSQELARNPDTAEIAEAMNLPVEKVRSIQEVAIPTTSLDIPLGEDGVGQLLDVIWEEGLRSPADAVDQMIQRERINYLVSELSEREARVLRLRFGLKDTGSHTLEETGNELNLTRERIRQIENQAIKRLRDMMKEEDK